MLGKTHMAVGIASALALTQPQSATDFVLAVGGGTVGALISDIDVGTSNSHRDADKIILLSFSALLAVLALDFFLHTRIMERIIQNSGAARILSGVACFLLICAFGKEQPHRSFMHSFPALILLDFAVGLIWQPLVLCFSIGFLSHLATDILTKRKLRLFYPSNRGFCLGLFHAHGIANRVLFWCGCAVAVSESFLFLTRIFH